MVHCDPDHLLAMAAQRRMAHAVWGLSISGSLSLFYGNENKHALWHEALHLLGAQDHYDLTNFKGTCELPSCIMRYAPDDASIKGRPFFCEKTTAILRKTFGTGK